MDTMVTVRGDLHPIVWLIGCFYIKLMFGGIIWRLLG